VKPNFWGYSINFRSYQDSFFSVNAEGYPHRFLTSYWSYGWVQFNSIFISSRFWIQ